MDVDVVPFEANNDGAFFALVQCISMRSVCVAGRSGIRSAIQIHTASCMPTWPSPTRNSFDRRSQPLVAVLFHAAGVSSAVQWMH